MLVQRSITTYFLWTKGLPLGHISGVNASVKVENSESDKKIRVGIVGARGYSGTELLKLLLNHPKVDVRYYFYSKNGKFELDQLGIFQDDHLNSLPSAWDSEDLFEVLPDLDLLFLATPHEVSLEVIPKILSKTTKVKLIDLSGAYRLGFSSKEEIAHQYQQYYKLKHDSPELLSDFTYGLQPYCQESKSFGGLVSNPGCYATSVLMALIPLLRANLIDPSSIVIDAKSGTSGGGKKAAENLLFSEVYNECLPYKIGSHQHQPEMELYLEKYSGKKVQMLFTPHLMPFHRGIVSSIYLKWNQDLKYEKNYTVDQLINERARRIDIAYQECYHQYPLITWKRVSENKNILNLKNVVNTAKTHIGYEIDCKNIYIFSLIDNLLKGAASQAIENMNLIYNWHPTTGL